MNIDRFARWYRWFEYAAFGHALKRQRFAFLDRLSAARRILILGEGDGRAVSQLLTINRHARIDVLEQSETMIQLARQRVAGADRVHFRMANALEASWPDHHYDGVMTFFFLDCFRESDARCLIQRIAAALAPGGTWLVSDFAIPDQGWRRLHAQLWIRTMYRFFRVTSALDVRTLPPIESPLAESGLRLVDAREERWGLIRAEVWRKD